MNRPVHPMFLVGLVVYAALCRLVPHILVACDFSADSVCEATPFFLSPITAICLWCGWRLRNPLAAVALPFAIMGVTDLLIGAIAGDIRYGLYGATQVVVYLAHGFKILLGRYAVRDGKPVLTGLGAGWVGEAVFFLTTNAATWYYGTMYSHDLQGLIECYLKGLPTFASLLAGTTLFVPMLMGRLGVTASGRQSRAAEPAVVAPASSTLQGV